MIYFDNAATSRPKPKEVIDAFNYYITEIGTSPGRGSYGLAIQASRMLYQARNSVARFFRISDPSNVVFTKNSTEAINLFLNGILSVGDHVLISPYEHNAVLRPLETLKNKGVIEYTVLPKEVIDAREGIDKYVKPTTALLVLTLASNLTGQLVFSSRLVEAAHSFGIPVFVDASQGAGKGLIDMERDDIDYLAFTGHKDLLALPGVGGLLSQKPLRITPLIQGGTGIHGESYINPQAFPDAYEAGTLNMPAIWALKASLEYLETQIDSIVLKENELLNYFFERLEDIEEVIIYNKHYERVPTFCFNIKDVPSSEIVEKLSKQQICVRGGIHCAIKAHETIGTVKTGAVRVSLNYANTKEEIDEFVKVIKESI